jgi:hypothetical protein
MSRKQQARMHKRQMRKQERSATPETYVLQARVEALALALICATLACVLFSYRTVLSAFVDVDRSVAGILSKERAPVPERPDSPNALYGPVRPGYATFAPPPEDDRHNVDNGSRYVPMSAAVSAEAGGRMPRGGYAQSSTASLSLERWRPSPSASPSMGIGARPVSPYGSAAPPTSAGGAPGAPQPGTWAAAAAAARAAAEAAQAQAQAAAAAASGMVAGVVPPAWQPAGGGGGAAYAAAPAAPPAWPPPPPPWQASQAGGAPLQPWQAAQAAQAAQAQQPPPPYRPAGGWQGGGGAGHLGDAL